MVTQRVSRTHALLGGIAIAAALSVTTTPRTAAAQVLGAEFASAYTLVDLGPAAGVPTSYGGLVVKAGDPNTLLLGGAANTAAGAIYNVGLVRGMVDGVNRITGLTGTATQFATAPNIDGGLSYGPGGVLFYTGYSNNVIGQIRPGSTAPDKIINLSGLGISSSVGALQFIPAGFPGAGKMIIGSYNANNYYTADLVADGVGTYNLANVTNIGNLPGGPEGIIFVPVGSPGFTSPSILVSEYTSNRVSAYTLDLNGIPLLGSRRDFITGLTGAEGANLDPFSNDFLFSTFGANNRVVSVRGFSAPSAAVPEPGTATLLALGAALPLLGVVARRRNGKRKTAA
ncbi:MAG TPA: PEP-CTERM sorting domain-containing protein [Armatimonadaceae bacterium]|nr:PEP-CTERM sorting domain-containing protein [Armatimonadaceae bacterium]